MSKICYIYNIRGFIHWLSEKIVPARAVHSVQWSDRSQDEVRTYFRICSLLGETHDVGATFSVEECSSFQLAAFVSFLANITRARSYPKTIGVTVLKFGELVNSTKRRFRLC